VGATRGVDILSSDRTREVNAQTLEAGSPSQYIGAAASRIAPFVLANHATLNLPRERSPTERMRTASLPP
jgi:hypothetical protein